MNSEKINSICIPRDNSFVGTTKRTWIDKENRIVGRRFEKCKKEKLNRIYGITNTLITCGIPVEQPIDQYQESGDYLVSLFKYYELDENDFTEEWYSTQETLERIKNAAKLFANFQQVAKTIEGPIEPLDYPYCNTLEWVNVQKPLEMILGDIYKQLKYDEKSSSVTSVETKINEIVLKIRSVLIYTKWGLCHGDYHTGNQLFDGDRIELLIDFGFWINHPIVFDLAIAIEFWCRNWENKKFELGANKVKVFIKEYLRNGGPITNFDELRIVLPIAKLWSDTFEVRKYAYPEQVDLFNGFIRDRVLDKLIWYERNINELFHDI